MPEMGARDTVGRNETFFEFKAGFNRTGTIFASVGPDNYCDVCCRTRATEPVLSIDSSMGEYGDGGICRSCTDRLFKNLISTDKAAEKGA